jgi:AcrR family transcriptional regulator
MVRPAPVQARAHVTIRRAIEVTADLIDERGEDGVRLQDVVQRSGVSAGSLTHHFGSREGLIAAALMERFDRAAEQRSRSFDIDTSDPDRFLAGMSAILASSAAGERDAWRLARIRVLAYSRHRPDLRDALIGSLAALEQEMSTRVAVAPERLSGDLALSPKVLVVFAESYSAGRIVDTVFGDPLPMEQWAALFARLIRGITVPSVADVAVGMPDLTTDVADQVAWGRPLEYEDRPAIPQFELEANEQRMLAVAAELHHASGSEAVRVRDLVMATGLSRSWFARHFGEREEVIDNVHLRDLIEFSLRESEVFEAAFDEACDAEDLTRRLGEIIRLMSDPEILSGAWNRLELVAAAATRPLLAQQAAPVVHATLERIAAAIAGAQERGLVHPGVPPRAAARFLWSAPLAFVLGEVVGVEWPGLHDLAVRTAATLVTTES